jgi:hypothetical protein
MSSNASNNTNYNTSSSRETKKWYLERVQKVLENRIQKLDAERIQIKSDAEEVKSDRTIPSKTLLNGALFAAPLILTFYAVDPSRYYILLVFAADIVFALIMFKIHAAISKRIHKVTRSTDAAFLLAIEKLNYFRHYFDMDIYHVDKITQDMIDRFYNFHTFASAAAQVGLIENFQKMIDSKDFDTMKSDLQERLRDKKELMDYGLNEVYRTQIEGWIRIGIHWDMLGFVYEDFFKYHGYTVDKKTGKITKVLEGKKDDNNKETTTGK